jgi:hypothetical protein
MGKYRHDYARKIRISLLPMVDVAMLSPHIYTQYYFCFGFTWTGTPWLYPAEVNSLRMRGRGAAFSTMNNWLCK